MAWHVYLVECADGTLYCGVTTDLARRLAEHNGAQPGGARYTCSRRPVRLLASAAVPDRAAACRLEARIKRLPRSRKAAAFRLSDNAPAACAKSRDGSENFISHPD